MICPRSEAKPAICSIETSLNCVGSPIPKSTRLTFRVSFINDRYDPANGIDSNLAIDRIEIAGTVYQTEAQTLLAGTYVNGVGIVPGFRLSEILLTNGYFQFTPACYWPAGDWPAGDWPAGDWPANDCAFEFVSHCGSLSKTSVTFPDTDWGRRGSASP